jgi:hypothetical protein
MVVQDFAPIHSIIEIIWVYDDLWVVYPLMSYDDLELRKMGT